MFKNYLKIAFRNLQKQKLYSLINITGLAVGLAVCMMIMLYVTHEMTYDRFHANAKRIYKLQASINIGGNVMNMNYMSYASGPLVKQSQPGVESYMRTLDYFKPVIVSNPLTPETKFKEEKLVFADPAFFNFFTFNLKAGTAGDVLSKPFSVVISQDMAKKYFGDTNPVGKTIRLKTDSAYTYQVTGVAENAPSNSSINYNFVASASSLLAMKEAKNYTGEQSISGGSFNLFLLLKNAADTANTRKSLQHMADNNKGDFKTQYHLSSITSLHLANNFGDFSNLKYLKIFPLVAVLILLLALVNYMSLTTARATLRAKEVGVRKVSGASRKAIAAQFYVESGLFTLLSFTLGYLLCYAFKPWFLNILQLKIDNSFLYSPIVLMFLFGLLLLTALISGIYPSIVLSSFKPVITLKGKLSRQSGGTVVRKVFTTLQFSIAVGLIICGVVIDRQLYYLRHADTGLNRENVVMIPVGNSIGKNYPALNKDVQALAGVSSVATSHYAMYGGYDMFFIEGKTKQESVALASLSVDNKFISTLGLEWKFAPTPNAQLATRTKIVINETAIKDLKLPANPVGSIIDAGNQKLEVAGVVKNFNFSSMESTIGPLGLFIAADTTQAWGTMGCNLFARIKPHTNIPSLIGSIENIYKKYDQETPFSYTFMDDAFDKQYKAEDRLAAIFSTFTYITILLATLGLFGLAAFTIEQRTKEIGIRKILGASMATITTLLSTDFLKLILLSVIIASPVAWYAMHNWLQNFAYRINIPWWVFALAGSMALITAIVTISYHAVKAALANPVNSLRSE
ncbi:ABC transporter permease [Mucilaginibacter sp. JC4]|uniref:ABC transporter permease n=1 Tax=Mucilaginibacter aquariorum TaxID=2967225 RepID=A0ABT1SXA1_9SPHI|nr:ABC transporter permease [Mucilaginibacter aquariorum]